MRGIFIQHPLEFRLEVTGDAFCQGAQVPARLAVKNHGSSPVSLPDLTVRLATGDLKKVKAKDEGAFVDVSSAEIERGSEVAAQAEVFFPCDFTLSPNSPISDRAQSPFLLYGNSSSTSQLGQLLLTVNAHPHIRSLFDSMTTVCSFINKGETWKNGWTTAKLKAPDAKRFSMVEELNLSCRFEGPVLQLRFVFSVKKFDGFSTKVQLKKGKSEVEQHWDPSDYLFGDGFIRQEYVDTRVEEALSTVASGF